MPDEGTKSLLTIDYKLTSQGIITYCRKFYEVRQAAGLVVEKANSIYIYAKGGYTDTQAQRNIRTNTFKRFEDM